VPFHYADYPPRNREYPSAANFYQFTIHDLKKKNISDINTLSKDKIKVEMKNAQLEILKHFRFQHRLKNGVIKDVEVYSGPIVLNEETVLYSIIHDISEEKSADRALKNRERTIRP
jgi:hypothetical protein